MNLNYTTKAMVQGVAAPINFGNVVTRAAPSVNVRVPFSVCHIGVFSNAAGDLRIGGTAMSHQVIALDPNATVGPTTIFGDALGNLAGCFTKYRLLNLSAEYRGCVPTSTMGSLVAACVPDGAVSNNLLPYITSCDGCVSGPVWSNFTIPCHIDKEWKFINNGVAGIGDADERIERAGVILFQTPAALTANSFWGWVRLSGVFEFMELSPTPLLTASRPGPEPIYTCPIPATSVIGPVETVPVIDESRDFVRVCPPPPNTLPPSQPRYVIQ